ncbi:MAG TPA: tRNA (adenosine(37)-N6)-threonylcarbamoyltransferase complex dimerization subunit type 1 TsaB [Candidatus Binatia bacterium]|nr:tRNA (adenosine(37)-N6)-threonylcarbamoyltransferase complex dimerization subunit type 1 TsaB [Candidatus Binatia bacterium]
MRIVGIDTATSAASVALIDQGQLIAERTYAGHDCIGVGKERNGKGNHAETLLPLIESLFESTQTSLEDISGLALSIGPGSFTGLRIGLSTVKGLAYGWQIPVVGVSTLWAHAARVTDYEGLICALLDARKEEFYAALFQRSAEVVHRVTEDTLGSAATVTEMIRRFQNDAPCLLAGDGADVYKRFLSDFGGVRLLEAAACPTVAAAVARLSEERFRSNEVDDVGALTPVYIRRSEAEFKRGSLL